MEEQWLPASTPYFEQYLHPHLPSLSISEIDYLQDLPVMTVGSAANWPPIEFFADDTFQGVALDYLNNIKKKLNIRTTQTKSKNWNQNVDRTENGAIQILTAVMEANDVNDELILTAPYASFQIVAMTRPNNPPLSGLKDMEGMLIGAVLEGELKTILEKNYPNLLIKNVSNSLQGSKDLHNEHIDVYIGNHLIIAHDLEQLKYKGLKVGLFTDHFLNLKMEVHRDFKQLVPIFNKLFASISNRENKIFLPSV